MVKVTGAAINNILKNFQDKIEPESKPVVRLTMELCWGGPKLRVALEESPLEDDEVIEQEGIHFLISERDLPYLDQAKVDYITDVFGRGQYVILRV